MQAKRQLKPHPARCCVDQCPALGKNVAKNNNDTPQYYCRWHRTEYDILKEIHKVHYECVSCRYHEADIGTTCPLLPTTLQTRIHNLLATHDEHGFANRRPKPTAYLCMHGEVVEYTSCNNIKFCTQCHGLL